MPTVFPHHDMKNKSSNPCASRKVLAGLVLSASLTASSVGYAQFLPTGAGPYDFSDTNNWNGGVVSGTFTANPTANQTVTFGADTILSNTLNIANTGTFNRTFVGTGGDRNLTLGGNINLGDSTVSNVNKVTIGSVVTGEKVNIDLGASGRTFTVGRNRTLEIVNVISGAAGITKSGIGTLRLSGTANTYTGQTSIGASGVSTGILEVTKLADKGQASSIGAYNGVGASVVFGGVSPAGVLRYVGAGDSSNITFLVGGASAVFDASGSGAINFTSSAAVSYASAGNARTITLTGTNTGSNTISSAFGDSGLGVTSFSKTGSGKWVLGGVNSYTGTTSVSAGTLVLGAAGSINNSVEVNIAAGASFDTTEKNFTMLSGQEFNFTLDATAGGSAGRLVAGALNITSGVVDFTIIGTLDDAVYILADYTSLTGSSFASVTAPSGYTIDYAYNGGTQIALVVPEPGSVALLTGGLCAVLFFRRNRRSAF